MGKWLDKFTEENFSESPEGLMTEVANDSTNSDFVHWSKLTSEERQAIIPTIKAGRPVRIFSEVLGEFVYWVHDEQTAERLKREPDYQGEVVYTLAELRELTGKSPELLRDIHQFKRAFGATFEKENPGENARSVNTVRCGDCQHFQRIDHPHMGRCAAGNGRHWLWDTDKRQCEDFEAVVEGKP
jgi:hypothetical protein